MSLQYDWLCRLYYDIGEQFTDFELQIAWKDETGTQMWSRRKSFLQLATLHEREWIERANNRTLLKNEIVLDYDRVITEEDVLKQGDILATITWCEKNNYQYAVYHTGSRGVHFHIFINNLAFMKSHYRNETRKQIIARFCGSNAFIPNFSGDYQKISDKVPIALEGAKHWKTGKPKVLIKSNFL